MLGLAAGQVSVWTKYKCQTCVKGILGGLFTSAYWQRKSYSWSRCDLNQTKWGKAKAADVIQGGALKSNVAFFKAMTVADVESIKTQCQKQVKCP